MQSEMPEELRILRDLKAIDNVRCISWKAGGIRYQPRIAAIVSYTNGFNEAFKLIQEEIEHLKFLLTNK